MRKKIVSILTVLIITSCTPLAVMADELLADIPMSSSEEILMPETEGFIDTLSPVTEKNTDIDNDIPPEIQYRIKNDPGIIYGPEGCGSEDEISCDGYSQTSRGVQWALTSLTKEEREWTINRVKEIVNEVLTDDMSDIEKYWTLAKWIDKNIEYPDLNSEFYNVHYYLHDTPHGAYGALKTGYGVCQGDALLYSLLCHAADLPCDEACSNAMNHMYNYIPDINGYGYYVDVCNNGFLMSDKTIVMGLEGNTYGQTTSKEGEEAPADCPDDSFSYYDEEGRLHFLWYYNPAQSSEEDSSYDDFYHTFIARDNKDHHYSMGSEYVEKGSGIPGTHYAHYKDYALKSAHNTGNWEIDDFYYFPKTQLPEYVDINDVCYPNLVSSKLKGPAFKEHMYKFPNDIIFVYDGKILVKDVDYVVTDIEYGENTASHGFDRFTDSIVITVEGRGKFCSRTQIVVVEYLDEEPLVNSPFELCFYYMDAGKICCLTYDREKDYRFESSDPSVATIDQNGIITAVSKGYADIYAYIEEETYFATVIVNDDTADDENKEEEPSPAPAKEATLRFTQNAYYINDGDKVENIFDGPDGTIYSSSKPAIVSIDAAGTITALKKGSSKITAAVNGKKYTVTVNVASPVLTGVDKLMLNNKAATLKVTDGRGATTWTSSDPSVITVDSKGKIKAVSKGTATITAVNNGRTMTKEIRAYNVPKFEKATYITNVGDPITVSFIKDEDIDVIYEISNKKIATIDGNGQLMPLKKGSVTVIAKAAGITYKAKIKIYDPIISGKSSVKAGKTLNFSIKNGNGKTVWSVDKSSIATITDKGKVKGISTGKVTITAVNNGRTMIKEIVVE